MSVKQKIQKLAKVVVVLPMLALLLALETWLLITLYQWVEHQLCPVDFQGSGHCYASWFDTFELIYFPLQFSVLLLSALLGFVVMVVWLGLRLQSALVWALVLTVGGYAYVFVISSGVLWVPQLVSLSLAFGLAFWVWKKYRDFDKKE